MGIYPSGIVYGIKIYNIIGEDSHSLFERQYNAIMDYDDMRQVRNFYETLSKTEKETARFLIYTECSSQTEDDFMMWYPISLDVFLKKFN